MKALLLGAAVALIGSLLATTSVGRWLEEDVALSWLFKLRGARPAPADVVVVSIDRASSTRLGLPNKPRKWPRSLHADLVRALTQQGVATIAFDIIFEEQRQPEHNRLLAEAIRDAGNVVLFQYLKQEPVGMGSNGTSSYLGTVEKLIQPIPILKESAVALAPFPLPRVPVKVNHFILYKPELSDRPTLPVTALQVYGLSAYDSLRQLLQVTIPEQITHLPTTGFEAQQHGDIHILAQHLRQLFQHNPKLREQILTSIDTSSDIPTTQRQRLRALVLSYTQPHSMYLNFYGPPQTITTIPYYQLLAAEQTNQTIDLKGKAVFVGFSEQFQPEQKDGFYTVYSEEQSGLDVSGVEIAATAFANLLQNEALTVAEAKQDLLIFLAWGLLLGISLRLLPTAILIPSTITLSLLYGYMAYTQFAQHNHWLPLAIPLLVQAPLAVVGGLLWKYLDVQRERRNIRHAFGFHLPVDVVDQLAEGVEHITATGEHVHGIVLATDAAQYTSLSETLEPMALRELMNRYYETLFTPIRAAHGIISDVVGDAAMAIWASAKPDATQRQRACQAAIDIIHAIEKFNQANPAHRLPTRLGLHFGEVIMGHVGAMDHYEYRATGDIVNTASRIEGLNKQLGTRILVSKEVLQDVHGFISRELGTFLLVGKKTPITLYELVGTASNVQNLPTLHHDQFHKALELFKSQQWQEAALNFEQIIQQYDEDGPSHYYLNLCRQYQTQPPYDWNGVIKLTRK